MFNSIPSYEALFKIEDKHQKVIHFGKIGIVIFKTSPRKQKYK